MWGRDPVPWKVSPDTPNLGTLAQTDDIRPGLTWQGLITLQNFVKQGGVFVAATNSTELPLSYGLTRGVVTNPIPASTTVKNSLLRTRLADATSPIAYGVADNLAVFSNDGQSFSVNVDGGGRGRGAGRAQPPVRTTGTGRPDDQEVIQGRPVYEPHLPPESSDQEQNRGQAPPMPAEWRPRTILRFAAQAQLLVSGLLNGGGDIADRANLVQVPDGEGSGRAVLVQPDVPRRDRGQLCVRPEHDPAFRQPERRPSDRLALGALRLALQIVGVALEHRPEVRHRTLDQWQHQSAKTAPPSRNVVESSSCGLSWKVRTPLNIGANPPVQIMRQFGTTPDTVGVKVRSAPGTCTRRCSTLVDLAFDAS